jgi:WD40 repeat protein
MSLAISPDGRRIATGNRADDVVRLWDADSGALVAELAGRGERGVFALAWSPDGGRLASLALDLGRLRAPLVAWDVATGESALLATLTLDDPLGQVAFAPDGSRLFVGADRALEVRDASSGATLVERPAVEIARSRVRSLAVDPTGERLATAHADGVLRLWSARDLEPLGEFEGDPGVVYSLAFLPDGSRLASGGRDGSLRLWDLRSRQQLLKLDGHTSYVYSVAVSPDGACLASGSGDGTVRVWDTLVGRERAFAGIRLRERRAALAPLVEDLLAELGDADAVARRLRSDAALGEHDREAALQCLHRANASEDDRP